MAVARRVGARPSAATSGRSPRSSDPEEILGKAMAAGSPLARRRWARRGLVSAEVLDPTTHAMLLRQLYLSYYEASHFERAHAIAVQAIALAVLPDVFHEDAARAALGAGDVADAVSHLRRAARRGPASRRPFHLSTLGSVLFLEQRYAEAVAVLARAARWGTHDKPLLRAQLALVRIAAGERVDGVQRLMEDLAAAPCGQGYGRFVLGHLAYATGAWEGARRFLRAFVERTTGGGVARSLALAGELAMARATLAKMASN